MRLHRWCLVVKNPPFNAGDTRNEGSISGAGRSPGGDGNPLKYSCLENPMDRGVCRTTVQGPSIPGFCAILFFTASDFTFTSKYIYTEHHFCFDWASSSFLALFMCSSDVLSFCLFILFMGFLRQGYWSALLFPSVPGIVWQKKVGNLKFQFRVNLVTLIIAF